MLGHQIIKFGTSKLPKVSNFSPSIISEYIVPTNSNTNTTITRYFWDQSKCLIETYDKLYSQEHLLGINRWKAYPITGNHSSLAATTGSSYNPSFRESLAKHSRNFTQKEDSKSKDAMVQMFYIDFRENVIYDFFLLFTIFYHFILFFIKCSF